MIVDDHDIYGNSVNIAARLEGLAEPGEVYVTRGVREQLQGQASLLFENRGVRRVKNIKTPDFRHYPLLTRYERTPESDPVKSGDRHSHVVRLLTRYLNKESAIGALDMPVSHDRC